MSKFLLIPTIAGLVAQIIKLILQRNGGRLRWKSVLEYGGMPSGHTAFVVALTTVVGLNEGFGSALFAVSLIFSLIIIRDAIGIRHFVGLHGQTLKMLIKELPDEAERKYPEKLAERLGHTPAQALVGGLIGFGLALLLNSWII